MCTVAMSNVCAYFSTALISALKNLQEKVRGLELERAAAAQRYKVLKEDTERQMTASSPKKVEEKAVQSSPFVSREHSRHAPLDQSTLSSEFLFQSTSACTTYVRTTCVTVQW